MAVWNVQHRRFGSTGLAVAAVCIAVAGFSACNFWSVHLHNGPNLGWGALIVYAVIGLVAGASSRRYSDALVSWAVAVVALMAASEVSYAVDPSWPRGETDPLFGVVLTAVLLFPYVAGGHVLGVAAVTQNWRSARPRSIRVVVDGVRSQRVHRAVAAATAVAVATFGGAAYMWWLARAPLDAGANPGLPILIAAVLAIGALGGAITRRFAEAPVSWGAAVGGWCAAYLSNYFLDPAWSSAENVLLAAAIMAPFLLVPVGAGHLIAVALSKLVSPDLKRGL